MSAIKEQNNAAAVTPDREIVTTRLFDAPREMVWEAFTDPKQVAQWWGPNGFTTTIHEMDVRPGGRWRHTMHGPDGINYPNASVFKEVVKPERIGYSHGGGKEDGPGVSFEATWTFETEGDKTRLTGRSVFATAAMRDLVVKEYGAIEGGKQTLAKLDQYLEKAPVVVERTYGASINDVWKAITDIDQLDLKLRSASNMKARNFPISGKSRKSFREKRLPIAGNFPGIPVNHWLRLSCFLKEKTRGSSLRITAWKRTMAAIIPLWRARISIGAGTNWAMSWKNSWPGTSPL
jgi:uncharacterized protein YndB with AHSA1/START domain